MKSLVLAVTGLILSLLIAVGVYWTAWAVQGWLAAKELGL